MTRVRVLAATLVGFPLLAVGGYFATTGQSTSAVRGPVINVSPQLATTAASFTVAPGGDDSTCTPCGSINGAYQRAQPGQVVSVQAGSYPSQTITARATLASSTCSDANRVQCVLVRIDGNVTVTGPLEIHGTGIWVDGQNQLDVKGYIDTEGDGGTGGPSNVIVENAHSVSFGVFNAKNVLFRKLDIGPGTAYWNGSREVCCREGSGIENKIGFAGGGTLVPQNVVLDGLTIHDQNGDATRTQPGADVHFGGLFVVTANGLVIENTTFAHNVVYNIQIQNFGGAPPVANFSIVNSAFGCPVDWLYQDSNNGANTCDGQASVQFDYAAPGVSILNSAFAGGDYGCYANPPCGNYAGDTFSGNIPYPASATAPPLPSNTPPPTTTTTPVTTTTASSGLQLTLVSKTNSTITFSWTPPGGLGYEFLRDGSRVSNTWNPSLSQVKFAYRAGSVYTVRALDTLVEGSATG